MSKRIKEMINAETALVSKDVQARFEGEREGQDYVDAVLFLGGIEAVNKVSVLLGAQSFRALQAFRDQKAYTKISYIEDGERKFFERFDDFLDKWPRSPMSKNEFYNRQTLLEKEGDKTFELLNGLGITMKARKALKKGEIAVDGDSVLVGDQVIAMSDAHQIKSVINLLADKHSEQRRTIERGKEEIKVLKKRIDEAPVATDGPRATQDFDSFATQAYLTAVSTLNDLEVALKQLPAAQRQAYLKEFQPGLELAFQNWTLYANGMKDKAIGAPGEDDLEKIFDAEISDDALSD